LGASLFFLGLAFGWAAASRLPDSAGLQPAWLLLAAASLCTLALGAVVGGLRGWHGSKEKPEWGRPVALDDVWRAVRVHGRQAPLWSLPRTTTRALALSSSDTLSYAENIELVVELWEGSPVEVRVAGPDGVEEPAALLAAKQAVRVRLPRGGTLHLRSSSTGLMDRDSCLLLHEIKA
jgi:hypothetical protein